MLEEFRESLEEKASVVKSLVHIQQKCEERELLLRRFLSQEDIARLVSERDPLNDTATVGAMYFRAVWDHNLRSFGPSPSLCCVGRSSTNHRPFADDD